jgi:dUTPase
MRIAQLVVQPVIHAELEEVTELEETHRGRWMGLDIQGIEQLTLVKSYLS